MSNKKHIIITGATGIIGVALIEYCLSKGDDVTAVLKPGSEHRDRLEQFSNRINVIECNLDNILLLPELVHNNCDIFYHLAWASHGRVNGLNPLLQTYDISYTLLAVEAAKQLGCHTFIGSGSQAEYGSVSRSITEDCPVVPIIPYGVAKYAAGKLSAQLCSRLEIRHIWARIFSVYGPYDRMDTMIMHTIERLLNHKKPVFTPAEQLWDFIYCSDAAKALYLLAQYGHDQSVYNVASGSTLPLLRFIETIRDIIDSDLPLGIGEMPYPTNVIMRLQPDITKLVTDTGFSPRVSFEDGIKQTVEFYKNTKW